MTCSANAASPLLAGAALADQLGAVLYATYVVTPISLWRRMWLRNDADALPVNLRLAETLGAAVVKVTATDTAAGLIAFASREDVTHAVFGHETKTAPILAPESTIAQFCRGARGLEVQVVDIDASPAQPIPRLASLGAAIVISSLFCILGIAAGLRFRTPWPAFVFAAAAAAFWCWWTEQQRR